MPKVSFVIPAYNIESYIGRCIQSVKNIPSYPSGKSRRLNAAKLISTLLRTNSTEYLVS